MRFRHVCWNGNKNGFVAYFTEKAWDFSASNNFVSSDEKSLQGCSSIGRRIGTSNEGGLLLCVAGADDAAECLKDEVVATPSPHVISTLVPVSSAPAPYPVSHPGCSPKGGKGNCDSKLSKKLSKKMSKKGNSEETSSSQKMKFSTSKDGVSKGGKISKRRIRY